MTPFFPHLSASCKRLLCAAFPPLYFTIVSLSVKLAEFQESCCKTTALGCKKHFARDLNPNLPVSWSCCSPVAHLRVSCSQVTAEFLGKGLGKLRVRVLLPSIPVFCINNWVLWMGGCLPVGNAVSVWCWRAVQWNENNEQCPKGAHT